MRNFFFLLFIVTAVSAQQGIRPGMVTPAVQLAPDSDLTYAIYLPSDYDASASYPAIFMFEQDGEGAKAVQQFSIAAALTKSIVVSPNSPVSDSLAIGLRQSAQFINTIYKTYAVDKTKIVLAGNGKGAMVATSSAQLNDAILGVIAINDAFIDLELLTKKNNTIYALINGDEGPNYYKMNALRNVLKVKDALAGYVLYEGYQPLPASGYLSAALTTIYLEKELDLTAAAQYLESDLAFGQLLYKQRKPLAAFSFVSGLKAKYKKKVDELDGQKELLRTIRGSKNFKVQRSQRNNIREAEQFLAEDFSYYMEEDVNNAYFDNLGWWNFQMNELDAKIDSTAKHIQERKAAVRLKKYVQAIAEDKYIQIKKAKPTIAQLLFVNVLRTLVNPNNADAFLQAISYSAIEGDDNAALFYLEELLKMGYKDYEALYEIEGTTALRLDQDFNLIIRAYLGKSKYY
ncbi:MAG: hypothetical protein CL867_04535 [Cytophagaceae bacterium]|nr:hypothetical protein [Cytophagaceae bacterium]